MNLHIICNHYVYILYTLIMIFQKLNIRVNKVVLLSLSLKFFSKRLPKNTFNIHITFQSRTTIIVGVIPFYVIILYK